MSFDPHSSTDDRDTVDLDDLRAAPIHDLRVSWRRTFRRHPPPGLTRSLLLGMLAYQRQVDVWGDLPPKHAALLDRIAARIARGNTEQGRRPLVPSLPTNSLQPGTVLVREWNGRMEAVTVVDTGFLWAGQSYATLSAVANAITGRHWNGLAFFGLKPAKTRSSGLTGAGEADTGSAGKGAELVSTAHRGRLPSRKPPTREVRP